MFLKIISNNNLVSKTLFFIFFIVIIVVKYFFYQSNAVDFGVNYKYFYLVINFLFLLFVSIGYNNMIYEKAVIKKNNLVHAFIFLSIHPVLYELKLCFIGILILLFFEKVIEIYFNEKIDNQVFYVALLISIISVFNFILLIYSLIPLMLIVFFKRRFFRHTLIYLLGLISPYFILYNLKCLFDLKINLLNYNNLLDKINIIPFQDFNTKWPFIVIIIISIFSFYELFNWINKKSIRSRKIFYIILLFTVLTIIIFVLGFCSSSYFFLLFSFPLSLFLSNYYLYSQRIYIKELLFFIFIFSMFFIYIKF